MNSNGLQDGTEAGISGATVNLTWAGQDGSLATVADNLIFSTATSLYGTYSFTHLPAGIYLPVRHTERLQPFPARPGWK